MGSWVLPTPVLISGPSAQDANAKTQWLLGRSQVTGTEGDVSFGDELEFGSFAAAETSGMGLVTRQMGSRLLPHRETAVLIGPGAEEDEVTAAVIGQPHCAEPDLHHLV